MNGDGSDALLNALLDGELGPREAAAMLERLRAEPALRDQWAQLCLTKQMVRHAWQGDTATPAVVAGRVKRPWRMTARRALAGVVLLGLGTVSGWLLRPPLGEPAIAIASVESAVAPAGKRAHHIVLHLSSNAAGQAAATLERAEGLMQAARDAGDRVTVEIVANGSGLDLLRVAATGYAQRIATLRARYPTLSLVACGQTVERLQASGQDVRLLPGTVLASSALDQVVQRLQQGWAYVHM